MILKTKQMMVAMGVGILSLCLIITGTTLAIVNIGRGGTVRAVTPSPEHSSAMSLFNLDGTINGQIAANILRDAGHPQFAVNDGVGHETAVMGGITRDVYRWTHFRLFPDITTNANTLSLSRVYWRIGAVLGEDYGFAVRATLF